MMLHSDLFDAELKYMQEREAREKAEARLATIEALRDDEQAAYLHELRGLATRVRQRHARTEQQQPRSAPAGGRRARARGEPRGGGGRGRADNGAAACARPRDARPDRAQDE